MTQRRRSRPRCFGCGLTPAICLCATLPRHRFETPIAIVQHYREQFKPTNTGRLLARMVEGAVVLPYGIPGMPFDPGPLGDPSIEWRLLFPREGAPGFDPGSRPEGGRRLGLVVLDGTWRQCSRMSRRAPVIAQLPCFALSSSPPPLWSVREQHAEHGRSTFEAALHALQMVEGSSAGAGLRKAFARVTAQLMYLKGELRSPEIPAGWWV